MVRYLYYMAWMAAGILIIFFLYRIRGIFPPFIFAIVLAYILNPVVDYLEKQGFTRLGALIALYFALVGMVVITTTEVIPIVVTELNNFSEKLPHYTRRIQELVRDINLQYARVEMPQSVRQVLDDTIQRGEKELINAISGVVDGFFGLFSHLLSLLIAPILAFYMLKDMEILKGMVVNIIPYRYRGDVIGLLQEVDRAVGGFIWGQVLVSILVGILSATGLFLLGIDFAILLGILAGITNIIPYFGPIIGTIPAVFMASFKSPAHILYVLILFFVIQQVESSVLAPTVIGEQVGLHPLVVIFALLVGGELFGLLGLLLAVPAAAILKALTCWLWFRLAGKKDRV